MQIVWSFYLPFGFISKKNIVFVIVLIVWFWDCLLIEKWVACVQVHGLEIASGTLPVTLSVFIMEIYQDSFWDFLLISSILRLILRCFSTVAITKSITFIVQIILSRVLTLFTFLVLTVLSHKYNQLLLLTITDVVDERYIVYQCHNSVAVCPIYPTVVKYGVFNLQCSI